MGTASDIGEVVEVLTERRSRVALQVLVDTLFVAAGIWLITLGRVVGWLAALFFGVLLVDAVVRIVKPGSLTLGTGGFTFRPSHGKAESVRWSHVTEFVVYRFRPLGIGGHVSYSLAWDQGSGRHLTGTLFGGTRMLPSYVRDRDLAARMNALRSTALEDES